MTKAKYQKLKLKVPNGVYPPSEDSLLTLGALQYAYGDVLDLCAGSGIIGLNAAVHADTVTLVDISEDAVRTIKSNAKANLIKNVKVVRSNLFSGLEGKRFDIIYCNPPYLPGKIDKKDWLDVATLGGKAGYELTIRIVKELPKHLKKNGKAFLVLSTAYDVDKVYKLIDSLKLRFKKIKSVKFFFEELILIEIYEDSWYSKL